MAARPIGNQELLSAIFAKMDVVGLALSMGVLCGMALSGATAILLLQPVPENYPIGPHLGALADYLPGYSVSWTGALVGAGYGMVTGAFAGFFIALHWNLAHYVAIGLLLIRSAEMAD